MTSETDKFSDAQSKWKKTFGEHFIMTTGIILAFLAIYIGYQYSQKSGHAPIAAQVGIQSFKDKPVYNIKIQNPPLLKNLLLVTPVNSVKHRPYIQAFRESVASYYGVNIKEITLAEYNRKLLKKYEGILVYGITRFSNRLKLTRMAKDMVRLKKPAYWVGHGMAHVANSFSLKVKPVTKINLKGSYLRYKKVSLPVSKMKLVTGVGDDMPAAKVMANIHMDDGRKIPAIIKNDKVTYIAFQPFPSDGDSLILVVAIDVLSAMLGKHKKNPRVLFRLEDVNAFTYDNKNTSLGKTMGYLLKENVFVHIGLIPVMVDASGKLLATIDQSRTLNKLVRSDPGKIEFIQHGTRHHRLDPRNQGKMSGDAYEYFYTDDHTLGRDVAQVFAKQRIVDGYNVLKRAGIKSFSFETPHYVMSPGQQEVANAIYSVMHHSPIAYSGAQIKPFMPWFTQRAQTVYVPGAVGYVDMQNIDSVRDMLYRLSKLKEIIPDPIVVVVFHPFMIEVKGRENDLMALIEGIKKHGYHFVSTQSQLVRAK